MLGIAGLCLGGGRRSSLSPAARFALSDQSVGAFTDFGGTEDPRALQWYGAESANLRSAFAWSVEAEEWDIAATIAAMTASISVCAFSGRPFDALRYCELGRAVPPESGCEPVPPVPEALGLIMSHMFTGKAEEFVALARVDGEHRCRESAELTNGWLRDRGRRWNAVEPARRVMSPRSCHL